MSNVNYQVVFGLIGATVAVTGLLIRGARLGFRTFIGVLLMGWGVFYSLAVVMAVVFDSAFESTSVNLFAVVSVFGVLPLVIGLFLLDKKKGAVRD